MIEILLIVTVCILALGAGGGAAGLYNEVSGDRARREYDNKNLNGNNYVE